MNFGRLGGRLLFGLLIGVLGCGAVAAETAAASTLQSPRLRIGGIRRAPLHQSVALRGVVVPRPATRTQVTATLMLGTARITLLGIVGRNGHFGARARELDLSGVLPDFGTAEVTLSSPVDTVATFRSADCTEASHGRALVCGGIDETPAGNPPDATYDAEVDYIVSGNHQPLSPVVASLTTHVNGDRGLSLLLSIFDGLQLMGPAGTATIPLTGYSVTGGDILALASGITTSFREAAGWRLEGNATSAPFGSAVSWTFVLRRPDTGTPAALGGTWAVDLHESYPTSAVRHASLVLTVPSDGHATTGAALAADDTGATIYDLAAGTCLVAPAGALSCYVPAANVYAVVLHGALNLASGTGTGQYYVGSPPFILAQGTWTARHMTAP